MLADQEADPNRELDPRHVLPTRADPRPRLKPAQLFQMIVNPLLTEDDEEREKNRNVQASWDVRRQVQRIFKGAKEKNVGSYARYVCQLAHGENGITPVIELYSEKPLKTQVGPYGTGQSLYRSS